MRILVVEESPNAMRVISKIVERLGSTIIAAHSGTDALASFERDQPDLILLTSKLLDINAFDVVKRIRFRETDGSWTPIILMTPPGREEDVAKGIAAGCDDYLLLPMNDLVLSAKLRAIERTVQMRTSLVVLARQLDAANQELRRLSASDGLTGIANRRYFDTMLEREWRRARRTGGALSLILCDIDFFKQYNDTYGHLAGDDCLRRVAQSLATSLVRGGDTPARYGGEEFVVLLPDTPIEGALTVAEKARQSVLDLHIPHTVSPHGWVSLSLGVANLAPSEHNTQESLIEAADQALYQAKHGGRNRVVAHTPSIQTTPAKLASGH